MTVSLNRGTYTLSGRFKGKPISKTVKSKGKPWYQNIAYNAGVTLKNVKTVEYECFRPDNMKLYTMCATKKGIEKFDGKNALRIEVGLTGFLSVFWSCVIISMQTHCCLWVIKESTVVPERRKQKYRF